MITRIYKYALSPTPMQMAALEEAGIKSRVLWNRLVSETKWAIHECENGRRANVANTYTEIMASKKMIGQRVVAVKKIADENHISLEDAIKKFVSDKTKKDTAIAARKDGSRYLRFSNKHLARLYAAEYINQLQPNILKDGTSSIWYGLMRKWEDFCKSWEKGLFDAPRFKKKGQISTIQKQIAGKFEIGTHVNLTWCGTECLRKVGVIYDRPIPAEATVLQIALTKTSTKKWFISIFLSADKSVFERKFTSTGNVVGVDPGIKCALTTSDGEYIQPIGLSKHTKKERKLKRLQRKLSRLTTQYNPQCFNADGTWKRGHRLMVCSKSMLEATVQIAKIKEYFKDAKADYYHNAAIKLLNQYDVIGIGNAKMHNLVRGHGKSGRAMNGRVREHAISDFVMKLKDKASLSLTPKSVFDKVSEVNTTRRCSECGKLSGPSGINDLSIRNWKCGNCGTLHYRDVNAAKNIRTNTISAMKAAAAQSVSEEESSKVRRSTKVPKKQSPRSMETTSLQSGGPMLIPFTSAQVIAQTSSDARISNVSVMEHVTQVISSVDSASPLEMTGCSQSQENDIINQ